LREEYCDRSGAVVRLFEAGRIETIEEIPTAIERTMTDLKSGGSTVIRFSNVSYKAELKPGDFNERLLKNPPAAFTR
jgi:acyl-CoA thioesterase FadM